MLNYISTKLIIALVTAMFVKVFQELDFKQNCNTLLLKQVMPLRLGPLKKLEGVFWAKKVSGRISDTKTAAFSFYLSFS